MAEKSQWKESISLEETNKIRISLGLKPISEGPSAEPTPESVAQDNYDKLKAQERRDKEAAALKDKLDRARNKSERAKKLAGAGLADEPDDRDDADADAKAWVKRQKKRQRELAAKRAKEMEEMDQAAVANYDENDLAGLKVAHGLDDFEEGQETVLTLKDSRVLDDEDDELHNVNISEHAKAAESVSLKKKGKQAYTGYDDDEFAEPGKKRGVLNKYDEDVFGKEDQEGFRLGAPSTSSAAQSSSTSVVKNKAKKKSAADEQDRPKLSMDYTKTLDTDYLREDEMSFKKPKKKKKPKTLRTSALAEGEDENAMDVDAAPAKLEREDLEATNLIDDDDLALSLARSRREANKKRIAEMKANAAIAPVKEEETDESAALHHQGNGSASVDDSLVLDDTSEFVRNISMAAQRAKDEAEQRVKKEVSATPAPRVKSESPKGITFEELDRAHRIPSQAESGEESEDEAMHDLPNEHEAAGQGEAVKNEDEDEDAFAGTSGELLVSRGLASTLKILQHQGLVKQLTPEEQELERVRRERDAWIALQKARDRAREEEKRMSKLAGSAKDQAQREYENRMRAQREAQEALNAFKDYKPVIDIKYTDEFGRNQTPKEAWKHLSHQFHGKTSGNKKREKLLKKIEEEKKREAMASGDTPTGTAAAFAARAERTGSATMVLSVGNRLGAPVEAGRYGGVESVGSLSKSNREKGKGKASANHEKQPKSSVFNDIPMRPLPVNDTDSPTAHRDVSLPPANGNASKEGSRDSTPGAAAAPRAGFAPVRSFAPAFRDEASPSGEKLQIPIRVKRKAAAEESSGPNKR